MRGLIKLLLITACQSPSVPLPKTAAWAEATFWTNELPFGEGGTSQSQRQGYAAGGRQETKVTRRVHLRALSSEEPHPLILQLNLAPKLTELGLTAATFDAANQTHRQIVGRTMLAAMQALNPGRTVVHVADTSRIDGANYGDATVRDTASSELRDTHHGFHIDKFFPGVGLAATAGRSDPAMATGGPLPHQAGLAGARWTLEAFEAEHWAKAIEHLRVQNVSHAAFEAALAAGQLYNIWMSTVPAAQGIEQQPLAFVDPRDIRPRLDSPNFADAISTLSVPLIAGDTITMLRDGALPPDAELWYAPNMKFGDALVFSTAALPHSAVWVEGVPRQTPRSSAEIRLAVV